MKYKIFISTIFVIIFMFTQNVTSNEGKEKLFWNFYLKGNYKKSAEVGKQLGKDIPEYYFLSSICYHNICQYNEYHITKGKYLQLKKDFTKLKHLLEKKEQQYKNYFQIYLLVGIVKNMLPEIKLKNAETYFNKSISLEGKNPYAYNYLSFISLEKSQISEAILFAKKAIEFKNDLPEPYNNLAVAYFKKGEKEKAIRTLLDCVDNCPVNAPNTLDSLINIISKEVVVTIFPNGKTYMMGAPGITDDKRRDEIMNRLRKRPKQYLEFVERYLEYNNITEVKEFLKGFNCPLEFNNLYTYLKARNAYLLGNNDEFIKLSEVLYNNYNDYKRLLEIGNIYMEMNDFDQAIKIYLRALIYLDELDIQYNLKLNSGKVLF